MSTNKENIKHEQPRFKKGDKCVFVYDVAGELSVLEDDMIINGDSFWYDYDNHPNKGYYLYPIVDKANECPEDLLRLYDGQKVGDIINI